jgi:Glycosyl transferases group 1
MTIKLEELVPRFARHVLHVGEVRALVGDQCQLGAAKLWSINVTCMGLDRQIIEHGMDCIVLAQPAWQPDQLPFLLEALCSGLNPEGQISLLLGDLRCAPCALDQLDQLLAKAGLMRYREGPLETASGAGAWGVLAVRKTYNPVRHARHLASLGRPDCAIAILDAVPMDMVPDNQTLARLALEKQRYYYMWQRNRDGLDPPHGFFSKARREFAQVTALAPHLHESYHLQATYWAHLGRRDMAARLLRSIGSVEPHAQTQQLLQAYDGYSSVPVKSMPTPEWSVGQPAPRILVITHDYSDYGMDTLFHGLCTLLGKDNVVEFPWKPTLHGQRREAANNYPCVFDYPGEPRDVSDLVMELRQGCFDLILYADVVQMAHASEVRQLVHAATHVPLVLYDTWDDCYTPMEKLLRYVGRSAFDLIFKREMLSGVDYGPHTHPLPFGYPESMVDLETCRKKSETLFWAGKQEYGLRPLYIPRLEAHLGRSLDQRYDQEQYRRRLRTSQIGLSFFGCGFDTVRYWELPANQVMLMAERPPIRIPYDFVDGQSAVFFDDLPGMERKLEYYLRHPEEVARIAAAGHAHFLRRHTSTARARQFLGTVAKFLGANPSARRI